MGGMGPRGERPVWAGLGRVEMTVTVTVRCGEGRGGGRADWDDGVVVGGWWIEAEMEMKMDLLGSKLGTG